MANKIGWGQGSVNNDIGWGQGASNNDIGWGNIQAISPSGETNIVGGSAPSEQLLLDEYPNAAAAYSLRELSTAFVGQPVVRVRRSSDNTEQDFTATEITDGTLTTFTGANDGFVTTWYDQSGNGVDGVQATANIQPKIVDNGVLESDNGKPTINFFAVTDSRLATSSDNIIPQPTTYFTVGRLNNTSTSAFFDSRLIDTNRQVYGNLFGGTRIGLYAVTELEIMPYTPETIISTTIFNSTNSKGYVNGIEKGVGDAGTRSINWGTIGSYVNAIAGNISTQEVILYPSNQDANRLPIETNINNHYLAYGDVINGGFLNTYQGFNGAYSLRKLAEYDNNYDVKVVKVRRSSDNINRDFTATEITDGTLESFVGVGNDGFVTTWYDQSTNQNHLFKSFVNYQPKIVENGVLLLNDGKPALKFDTDDNLYPLTPINSKNVYIVEKTLDFSPTVVGLLGDSTDMWTGGAFGTITGIAINDGTTTINSNVEDLNTHLIVGEYDVNGALYVDGNLEGTASLNSGTISIVGKRAQFNFNGYIQELLISDLDVSANRTAIETNINNEYNIW